MSRINVANFRHPDATADSITVTSDGDTQINRALGLGGATYGTSGQVLTSQGSGSAPQWATPVAGLTKTTGSSTSLSGSRTTLTGVPANAVEVIFFWDNLYTASSAQAQIQFTVGGSPSSSGYEAHCHFSSSTTGFSWQTTLLDFPGAGSTSSTKYNGLGRMVKRAGNDWYYVFTTSHEGAGYYWQTIGTWSGSGALDGVSIFGSGGTTFSGGSCQLAYYS